MTRLLSLSFFSLVSHLGSQMDRLLEEEETDLFLASLASGESSRSRRQSFYNAALAPRPTTGSMWRVSSLLYLSLSDARAQTDRFRTLDKEIPSAERTDPDPTSLCTPTRWYNFLLPYYYNYYSTFFRNSLREDRSNEHHQRRKRFFHLCLCLDYYESSDVLRRSRFRSR
jgi:hypothetical protein